MSLMNELFPVFLKLRNRRVLVVGGGTMAALRVRQLLAAGARVTVIAPDANESLISLARAGSIELLSRAFARSDATEDYFVAIGATDDPAVQSALAEEAERHGILYNLVDDPERCNFFTPAVVERGDLKIAISTNGQSPVLARRLRRDLEAVLPAATEDWVSELGRLREKLRFEIPVDLDARRRIIEEVIERTVQR